MNIKERLHVARQEYINKYQCNPNVIFISNSLFSELNTMVGGHSLYDASPTHLFGADVIMVLTGDYVKFAEHSDLRKAIKQFNTDNSLDSYKVKKSKTTIGAVNPTQHFKSKVIDLEPIEFSKEEIEIYSMQI